MLKKSTLHDCGWEETRLKNRTSIMQRRKTRNGQDAGEKANISEMAMLCCYTNRESRHVMREDGSMGGTELLRGT